MEASPIEKRVLALAYKNRVIPGMNLSQLYYFRKLAELQHYTKAAKELYISQPALSDAIKSLERELGVPLFKREGRNVRLTRYGREFADYVGRALRELDRGVEVMHEYTGKLSGTLKVGALYTVTGDYLPSLIEAFHEKYSAEVHFEIMQGFSNPLIQGLKDDRYDIVFAAKGFEEEPALCFEPVSVQEVVIAVNEEHPLASKDKIQLEDLVGHNVITYRRGTPVGDEMAELLAEHHIPANYEFDDEITVGGMLSAIKDDTCALVLNTIGLKPFTKVSVVPIDENEVPYDFHQVYMVYKKAEFKNLALESFIEFVMGLDSGAAFPHGREE